MLRRFTTYAGLALMLSGCESPPPAFDPAPESYTASRAMIEGVAGERTIASVDSTFFGRNLPMLGRTFVSADYGDRRPVAVLSHGFWVERFGERPEVIGSHLEVAGVARTVVGVMPGGVDVPEAVALWIPREGT